MLHSPGVTAHLSSEPVCFPMEQLENTWASQSYSNCLLLSLIKQHSVEPQALYYLLLSFLSFSYVFS